MGFIWLDENGNQRVVEPAEHCGLFTVMGWFVSLFVCLFEILL